MGQPTPIVPDTVVLGCLFLHPGIICFTPSYCIAAFMS